MSPEERELLEKNVALAEDNNKILHSIRRSMRLARIMTYIYWILIIGFAIWSYYLIQPYLDQAIKLYGNANSVLKTFKP